MISFTRCFVKVWERGLRRSERIGESLIRGLSFLPFTSFTAILSSCLTPFFCQHVFPLRGDPSGILGYVRLTVGSGGSRSKLLRVIRIGRGWRHLRNPRNRQSVMSLSWYVDPASDRLEESDRQTHLLSLTPPHPTEAAKFVARCDSKSRVDLYVKCGDWAKAAESAEKDRGRLE